LKLAANSRCRGSGYLSQLSGTLSYGQGRQSRIEQVTVDTSAAGLTVIDQP
jgi:hypothetical protein